MTWYNILKAARRLSKAKTEITSATLAEETGLEVNVASAWLSNFYHWGYVLPVGKRAPGRGRPTKIYKLTRWGERFRPAEEGIRRIEKPLRKAANPKEEP